MRQKSGDKQKRGFTLIELIVVLAVLMILVSITVPSLAGFIEMGKEQRCVLEAQQVRRSINLYLVEHDQLQIEAMDFLGEMPHGENGPDKPHVLEEYLLVKCSDDAAIEQLTFAENDTAVDELIYRVGTCWVTIEDNKVTVEQRPESGPGKR
ncbi:MAG: type II secretion system protein [Lachnospiraceae bacterium]|nr:type II secretion system protein [Lachnospiraceae bacterium]